MQSLVNGLVYEGGSLFAYQISMRYLNPRSVCALSLIVRTSLHLLTVPNTLLGFEACVVNLLVPTILRVLHDA